MEKNGINTFVKTLNASWKATLSHILHYNICLDMAKDMLGV